MLPSPAPRWRELYRRRGHPIATGIPPTGGGIRFHTLTWWMAGEVRWQASVPYPVGLGRRDVHSTCSSWFLGTFSEAQGKRWNRWKYYSPRGLGRRRGQDRLGCLSCCCGTGRSECIQLLHR